MLKSFIKEWKKKEPKQKAFMGLGALFLAFALIGVFVPILPQVPFAVAAAYFFSKGSAHIHEWIRENKYFGPPVKNWEDDRIIHTKLKVVSTLAMMGGAGFAYWKMNLWWMLGFDLAFALALIFVWMQKSEKPRAKARSKPSLNHPIRHKRPSRA